MTTRDRILNLFRSHEGAFVSGQEISTQLGISRAAVWKQVKGLQQLGFTIEAKHAQGYRLLGNPAYLMAADIERGLKTRIIGRQVVSLEETDSTNIQIKALAEQGALEGAVLVADRQSAGRGRLGRRWESPSGVNLYCSILLKPHIPVQQAPQLTFLSAAAVAETMTRVCQLSACVKWPNDILVNGAKIAGLLNEMNAETEQIHFVILGIGINLNMTAEQLPTPLNYPATSVFLETGQQVDRALFLRTLLEILDHYYTEFLAEGFLPIRRRWERLCAVMNSRVTVDQESTRLSGTVVGLDVDGALRLQCEDGRVERILAGDVRLLSEQ
ncbi:MAG: biotin--[acetyl-CoA-carboxylase] ligase [Desulfuromonadales bacterium]|nr:biotin--[acetyl-CoA-carboxylase] ligase [Desulfuromonadales bacterium]MBN2791721.1 biotin--[acetyl-CoA-carboxylase] ligase [Desulfuromonadales bacterium]